MESLYKYRSVGIAHDTTKKEHEECKTLNEAKVKTESESGGPYLSCQGFSRTDEDCLIQETVMWNMKHSIKTNNEKFFYILYTDCLANKIKELEVLICSLHFKPAIIAVTEVKHKNNGM